MKTISLGNKKRTYKSIKEAAEEAGLDYMVLYMRLRNGWTLARAMSTPVKERAAA